MAVSRLPRQRSRSDTQPISRAHVLKYMQAEYEHSILNVFQVMITNSRVDTRVDVSEQTYGQTNVRKLAHLYGAAEADT